MWKRCCCLCARETYEPPDVQELDYRHNSLSEVPAEIFTYERTLEKLLLGSNQITDLPPNLFYCHELRELDICDNELKEIPAAIESLTRLVKLNVNRNALTEVPESIKNCKNLAYLDLGLNTLSKIPEAVCQLVHLEELFLNETALDFLPANFGRLTRLRNLELRDNSLGTLPMSMSRLSNLQRLDIGCNEMEELPAVIASMTNLLELWADDSTMRQDCNSKVLGSLQKLTCLDLSKNNINSISDQIGKCCSLVDLTLSINDLQELPNSFTKLENCATIRLDNNRLTRLPEDFGKMKNLQELNCSFNLLKTLPTSFGLLRRLQTVYLDDNRLTELPKEIGSCVSLSVLSVANNSLSEIPSEIGHLSNLKVLILTNNFIRNLPVSILGLNSLGALWLTEGQNKPMVTLNREIDPATGQHVVTCCLLPQIPAQEIPITRDDNEVTQRRSGRKIRFESDIEPPLPEKPIANGGLLRAPTPYPKELRAMAKHASQIRQVKNQNGEAVNVSDEPMYEGEMNGDSVDFQSKQTIELTTISERQQQDNQGENYKIRQQQHHEEISTTNFTSSTTTTQHDPSTQYSVARPPTSVNEHHSSAVNSVVTSSSISSTAGAATASREYPYQQQTLGVVSQQQSTEPEPIAAVPLLTSAASSSFAVGRTPPPYHIAAQRAAFFRSSGGAGTGKINFPSASDGKGGVVATETGSNPQSRDPSPAETPPISPNLIVGGPGGNANSALAYESALPQISPNNVAINNINEVAHGHPRDSYESTNLNELILQQQQQQYQNQGVLPPLLNQKSERLLNDNGMMTLTGNEINDNAVPGMLIESSANANNSGTPSNSNPVSYGGGMHSDRNGNITTTKSHSQYEETQQHHSNNNANYQFEDNSREESLPPPMPLLMDNKDHHHQQQQAVSVPSRIPESSHIPPSVSHPSKIASYKSPESKVCRIPSLQSSVPKRPYSTSQISNIATPSRIPSTMDNAVENNAPQPPPPVSSLVLKEVSGIPHPRMTSNNYAHPSNEQGYAKGASTSRIPSGIMYSSPDSKSIPVKRNTPRFGAESSGIRYGGGGTHSGIPRMDVNNSPVTGIPIADKAAKAPCRIPKLEAPRALPEDMSLRSSSSTDEEKRCASAYSSSGASEKSLSRGISPKLTRSGTGRDSDHGIESRIPSGIPTGIPSRKPWIFGSHRNARVVSVEHRKINQFKLGFTIVEFTGQTTHPEGKGIYVTAADSEELPIKVGDKILQVDGIDVGDMGVEIVNKILSNCQENIQLLVSRQH